MSAIPRDGRSIQPRVWRVGAVSYLNSKPLVFGLDGPPDIQITFAVPARLPSMLDDGLVDVALVPVVDLLQRGPRWKIVSDACIGCNGETLTVRLFSRIPPHQVRRIAADPASHTSVALVRVLWRECHGCPIDVRPLADPADAEGCEAVLLIGDKVIAAAPYGFTYHTDLGGMWKSLTGLPFVFAVWAADEGADLGDLPARLSAARDQGLRQASLIAQREAPKIGWPVAVAQSYLTRYLSFTLDAAHREGMETFLRKARPLDATEAPLELTFG